MVQAVEELQRALLLDSTGDRELGPCKPWSHRDRSIFHTDCKRTQQVDSGGRSIDLELEL